LPSFARHEPSVIGPQASRNAPETDLARSRFHKKARSTAERAEHAEIDRGITRQRATTSAYLCVLCALCGGSCFLAEHPASTWLALSIRCRITERRLTTANASQNQRRIDDVGYLCRGSLILLGSTNAIARLAQHRRRLARVTAGHGHAPFAQANNYLQKTNKMADGWHQGSVSAGVPSLPGHRSIDREASRRDDLHRVFRPHVHGYHALNQGDVMSVYGTAISTILHDEATEVVVSGGAAKFTTVRRRPTMIASRHALGRSVKMPPWRTNCHAVPTTGPIRDVRHEASKCFYHRGTRKNDRVH